MGFLGLAVILWTGVAGAMQRATESAARDINAGRLDLAERKLDAILRADPDSADASYLLGVVRFQTGRLPEAAEALDRAVARSPRHGGAWKLLGMVRAASGDFEGAASPFRKACELIPRDKEACYYLGRNDYVLSRFKTSIEAFRKALSLYPDHGRVYRGLALSLEAEGEIAEAEKHFVKAVSMIPPGARGDDDPRVDFGVFLYRRGRLAESRAVLEKAVKAHPDSARAHFELGRVLSLAGELEPALVALQRAVALEPGNRPAHLLLAKVCFRLGRAGDGERHLALGRPEGGAEAGGTRPR
jgi:tetratricopeptide (TPR) repeat protein